jgi:hypothetical protein
MRLRGPAIAAAATVLLLLLGLPDTASAQCAMCRSLLGSPEGQRMIAAFRGGILLLLAAPFVVFATIAVVAVRAQSRRLATADGPRAEGPVQLRPNPVEPERMSS